MSVDGQTLAEAGCVCLLPSDIGVSPTSVVAVSSEARDLPHHEQLHWARTVAWLGS